MATPNPVNLVITIGSLARFKMWTPNIIKSRGLIKLVLHAERTLAQPKGP